jgi:hypothetical protein
MSVRYSHFVVETALAKRNDLGIVMPRNGVPLTDEEIELLLRGKLNGI